MEGHKINNTDELIIKYLSGKIDAASFDALIEWSNQSTDNLEYIKRKMELWLAAETPLSSRVTQKQAAYSRFVNRIYQTDQSTNKHTVYKRILITAACIAILLLPLAGFWLAMYTQQKKLTPIVVETPLGSRTHLQLPDGSRVWLNAGSKLTYSHTFGRKDRQLSLIGEGYFDVVHNEHLPFEINFSNMRLKVLGTCFNVRNYQNEENSTVALTRGKVSLENSLHQQLVLAPGERMIYDKHTKGMKKEQIDKDVISSWIQGKILFDEVTLQEIARDLSRYYRAQIVVAPQITNMRFYGTFNINNSTLDEVLKSISATKLIGYRYDSNQYYLYPNIK